ncbi:hypothetical protein EMIHUDRAFT_432932 [Emiliania huxleyi CCMP1516]|uniref:Uncharacterized protein n=2 Tax=Emiliania huxleyi TaxID=2903 RepID=A0A0D3IEH0_EMIH1|nr:hypothetical protein EMIHUDRAFT_432932 [Emiliania huxleyi CCMP1516]EOD09655.1 hypothetical protein EMIHUDRAFT_432932 [Emiliania huxleyi CCMP1516]|eukprot:XP_005762084.1 hypothetical protein EMIHUDRAFT_432932 [Emiliania huxleyi CCMP1516]
MINWKLYVTALLLPLALGWNSCSRPDVEYFQADEGAGTSFNYAAGAMNGKVYTGGYFKGTYLPVGYNSNGMVAPVPGAVRVMDATSDDQHLQLSETDSTGKLLQTWFFEGTAKQVGSIGHGAQTNEVDSYDGIKAMLDDNHLSVKMGFRQQLTLPDGTTLDSAYMANGDARLNTNEQVQLMIKLDVSKAAGIGPGTTGWYKILDEDHPGYVIVRAADGDAAGNMILSYKGCDSFNATKVVVTTGWRGTTTTVGEPYDCAEYLTCLASSDGSTVWRKQLPEGVVLDRCRATVDGSFFCGFNMAQAFEADFGNGVVAPSEIDATRVNLVGQSTTGAGLIKYNSMGEALWVKRGPDSGWSVQGSSSTLSVSRDGTLLAMTGPVVDGRGNRAKTQVSRIDTSNDLTKDVLWTDIIPSGSHGFRGMEVMRGAGQPEDEVVAMGQIYAGWLTLTDDQNATMTLRSIGQYDVFVVAYDATTGAGKWAMDGGSDEVGDSGTGDYFFAFTADAVSGDIYVGGGVYSGPSKFRWGDLQRDNVMHDAQTIKSSGTSPPHAFLVNLKSVSSHHPECLNSCDEAVGVHESNVNDGYCYIDRYCYKDGTSSPYVGHHCYSCNSTADKLEFTAPEGGRRPTGAGRNVVPGFCFIDGVCYDDNEHESYNKNKPVDPCNKCDTASPDVWTAVNGCLLAMEFVGAPDPDGIIRNGMCEATNFEGGIRYNKDGSVNPVGWELEATAAGWGPLSCGSGQTPAQQSTAAALRQRRVMKVAEGEQWWP